MYVIKMKHISAEPGVYTTEEQTATNEIYANMKYERMFERWFGILCPHINYNLYEDQLRGLRDRFYFQRPLKGNEGRMNLINLHLQSLNLMDGANRSFEITMEGSEDMSGFESTASVVEEMTKDD